MPPEKHALLSASSASRWLVCTAAPRFEEGLPESTSSYAEEGRLAHAIGELKVLKKFTTAITPRTYTTRLNKLKKEELYDPEMDKTTDLYLEHLVEQAMLYDSTPTVAAEVQVDFSEYVPEGFGTCDCVMIGGDMGCFGAPLTGANVTRYCNNHSYNKDSKRTAMIKAAANQSPPVYGFDCVNLIKGVLWGWCGAPSKTYGGAGYAVNGVPDVGADGMIKLCTDVSTTGWASMVPGEAVWCSGHIGVYIGNGLAVECTPRWENNVQITAVANIGKKAGYNTRTWTKHGKMPWVDYTGATTGGSVGEVSEPTKPAASAQGLTVGAVVAFTGTKHYVSSSSTAPKNCKPGEAKITAVVKGARHPYHLVRTAGSASTVYGWVDATDITTEASGAIVKGSTVKVKKGAKTYTGGGLASFVYSGIYTVLEVSGSRVVIGKGNAVTAAVNIKDLTLVG